MYIFNNNNNNNNNNSNNNNNKDYNNELYCDENQVIFWFKYLAVCGALPEILPSNKIILLLLPPEEGRAHHAWFSNSGAAETSRVKTSPVPFFRKK